MSPSAVCTILYIRWCISISKKTLNPVTILFPTMTGFLSLRRHIFGLSFCSCWHKLNYQVPTAQHGGAAQHINNTSTFSTAVSAGGRYHISCLVSYRVWYHIVFYRAKPKRGPDDASIGIQLMPRGGVGEDRPPLGRVLRRCTLYHTYTRWSIFFLPKLFEPRKYLLTLSPTPINGNHGGGFAPLQTLFLSHKLRSNGRTQPYFFHITFLSFGRLKPSLLSH